MNRRELLINHMLQKGYKYMESDVFDMADRIKEYDEDLILFFNTAKGRYEIHSCTFFPSAKPTYCVSSNRLEDLIKRLMIADNATRYGFKEKMNDIDKSYKAKEKNEKEKQRDKQRETKKDIEQRLKLKQHFAM